MNQYVFAYPGAPLKHLRVSQRASQLGLTGTLHKGVDIPFDITSTVGMMADNRMRLHPTRIRIFGVDGKALMGALGLNLQKMLDLSKAKGVTVDGNDVLTVHQTVKLAVDECRRGKGPKPITCWCAVRPRSRQGRSL